MVSIFFGWSQLNRTENVEKGCEEVLANNVFECIFAVEDSGMLLVLKLITVEEIGCAALVEKHRPRYG